MKFLSVVCYDRLVNLFIIEIIEKKDSLKTFSKIPSTNKILLGMFLVVAVVMIVQGLGDTSLGLAIGLGSFAIGVGIGLFFIKKANIPTTDKKTLSISEVIGILVMGIFLLTYVIDFPPIVVDYKYFLVIIAMLIFILGQKKETSKN